MDTSNTINLIKESFETWYNYHVAKESPVAILINYNDTQKLSLKAFHTVTFDVHAVGTVDNLATITKILSITENYNHGTTSEQEAKDNLTKKLLGRLYSFQP